MILTDTAVSSSGVSSKNDPCRIPRSAIPLFTSHPTALNVLFADVESQAIGQIAAFAGTPGSVVRRRNASGFEFYARQFYDGDGKQRESYIAGPIGDPEADAKARAIEVRVAEVADLVPTLRMLARERFVYVNAKTWATIAALHNHGVFAAGGMLVGSHAYGVLLNRMGIRAAPYATEDIDIAGREALAFAELPQAKLLEVLRESGVPFVEVPSLRRKKPATSLTQRGKARFHVELLVPSPDESFPVIAVPELKAHATGLPYLGYLLAEHQTTVILARQGACAVRVPVPERLAIHKLLVSQLRTGRQAKSLKDLHQAAVLCAALAQDHPGAISDALSAVPSGARRYLPAALAAVEPLLAEAPRAWEELGGRTP